MISSCQRLSRSVAAAQAFLDGLLDGVCLILSQKPRPDRLVQVRVQRSGTFRLISRTDVD